MTTDLSSARTSTSTRRATITIAIVGVFVAYLPINSVSTALSAIRENTGAAPDQLQWVTSSYVVAMAVAVLSAGVLGEVHGRRKLLVVGLVLTSAGAVTAGAASIASSLPVLWVGQAVAGLGGGILLPVTLALISHAVPDPRERGRFIAGWVAGTTAALAVGPVLTGVLLTYAGWGWIFAPGAVLSAGAAVFAARALEETSSPEGRSLDWWGQVSAALAIGAGVTAVIRAGRHGADDPAALIGAVVAATALAFFVWWERRTTLPLVSPSLFTSPRFVVASISAALALFSMVGLMFLLSLILGSELGLSALEVGLRIAVVPAASAVTGLVAGRWFRRLSPVTLLASGLLANALGTLAIMGISTDSGFVDLAWRLMIFGAGSAVVLSSVATVAVTAVEPSLASMAGATNTALRQVGGAFGPAALGTIYVAALSSTGDPIGALQIALCLPAALLVLAAAAALVVSRTTSDPLPRAHSTQRDPRDEPRH